MRKALLALPFTLLSITATIGFAPTAAFAHAGVVATSPAQDEVLTAMPAEISVEFTEELLTISGEKVNSISLTHFDGPAVELTDLIVDGRVISAKIPEGDYEAGTYEVFYTIVSADGHKVSDSYSFSLNAPLIAPAPISEHEDHQGFFHIHRVHIAEVGVALMLLILWVGYRRFNREQEK